MAHFGFVVSLCSPVRSSAKLPKSIGRSNRSSVLGRFMFSSMLALFLFTVRALSQVPDSSAVGFPPFSSHLAFDVDSVQESNGNLHIEIPIASIPGRGKEPIVLKYVYDSHGWTNIQSTKPPAMPTVSIYPDKTAYLSIQSPLDYGITYTRTSGLCYSYPTNWQWITFSDFILHEPDGTRHHFPLSLDAKLAPCAGSGSSSGSELADDGSGWLLQVSLIPNWVFTPIRKDGVTVHQFTGTMTDTNGNQAVWDPPQSQNLYLTDTLGRTINLDGSYVDSSGVLRSTQVTTTPVSINLSNLAHYLGFAASSCINCTGTPNLINSITLPNGLSYQISYVQGGDGQPSSITLPSGATISYTWHDGDGNGPMVASRTVVDPVAGTSETWTFTPVAYGGMGYRVGSVIDPAGNEKRITCLSTGVSVCGGISKREYFSGSASSGTLLKTVQTDYQDIQNTCGENDLYLPIRDTTTWNQINVVTKTETDWDAYTNSSGLCHSSWGNPTNVREYAYGSGAPGSILRTTSYLYLHQSQSAYAQLNIADRVTSKSVSGTSGQAQTQYAYDGSSLTGTSNAPGHDYTHFGANFRTRGNVTQISRWVNTNGSWLNTNNTYNDLGEILTSSDPLGHTTTYDYTDGWVGIGNPQCVTVANSYAFPTTITDALGHPTKHNYYSCTSLLGGTQDANDIAASRPGTTFSYDLMNRVTAVNYPDGGQTTVSYNDAVPYAVTSTQLITSNMSKVSTIVLNGLGRVQQRQLIDPDCSHGPVKVDYTYSYDPSPPAGIPPGRFITVSNPYCTTSNPTYGVTKTRYDALDRPVLVVPTDGTDTTNNVATAYSGNLTTVTDQTGAARKSQTDALGRLTSVWEDPAHANYETDYVYDVLDDLTGVMQKGGSTSSTNWRSRSFQYDSLARLTQATNPESGTITYSYDADGNLKTKTAPSPNQPATGTAIVTTTYTYDALNRLVGKTYNDGYRSNSPTPASSYAYDGNALTGCTTAPPGLTDSNPVARRTSMCDGSGATSWAHDPMGRVLKERRTIGAANGDYDTDTYNLDGSVASLSILGYGVTYTYSGAARPLTATHYASTNTNFVSGATYAPPGELAGMTMGSATGFAGITVANAYNNRLQPILLSAVSPTGTVFSECFDFHLGVAVTQPAPCSFSASTSGDNGNVYQIVNNRDNTRSQNFNYDSLNRIQQAYSSGTQWGETFAPTATSPGVAPTTPGIDAWGNLTNRSGVTGKINTESWSVSAGTNNQLTGFGYDPTGNLISNGSTSYVYDDENRVIWTNSSSGYHYLYDGDGQRVEKCVAATSTTACPTSGTSGTLYWKGTGSDPLSETDLAGNVQNTYVFFNGQRVARSDSAGAIHYYFSDHLGSHGVVENATGSACEQDIDYYPYGGVENDYCPSGAQKYKFTGKERDSESGLDDFVKRYFGSSLGRFMTPDPAGIMKQKLVDPQQWNMYAYVRNNPLRFVDPFGMYTCAGTKQFCARVKAAYEQIQKAAAAADKGSDQQKQLNKVLKFLGKPGEANYVSVTSGSLSAGELGKADTSTSTDLLGNRHTSTQITLDVNQADTIAKLNRKTPLWGTEPQDDAGVLGHEGTHGVDQFPLGHNPETQTQEHATEMNAYRNQSYIYTELGFKSMLDLGLSADTEAQRNQAINAGADRSTAAWCEEGGGCD